jgi:hypothetical protein
VALGDSGLLEMTMQQATAYYGADVTQIPAQRRRTTPSVRIAA